MTKLQENILQALAAGIKTKDIADNLNCSISTVKKVRADKELQAEFETQSEDSLEDTLAMLSVELRDIIKARETPMPSKIQAIKELREIISLTQSLTPTAAPQPHVIKIVYAD